MNTMNVTDKASALAYMAFCRDEALAEAAAYADLADEARAMGAGFGWLVAEHIHDAHVALDRASVYTPKVA